MEFKPTFPKFIATALTVALSVSAVSATAEDGTSGTVPESLSQCEIVAAEYTQPSSSPAASPVASPVASPAATPVVEEAEEDPLVTDLEIASTSILNCMSSNNLDALLQLTGEQFRGSWLGVGEEVSDEDFSVFLPMMPTLPYALVDVTNATSDGETATATVRYINGRQLHTAEWTYKLVTVDDKGVWQVVSQTSLPTEAPADASSLDLAVDDGSFTFNPTSTAAGDVVISISNNGEQTHEVLIVRVPEGTEVADFAAAPNGIPEGGTFIGQVTIPAGTEGNVVLTDVRAGTYTVVDLLPDANGTPNVSNGMITTFTVEEP